MTQPSVKHHCDDTKTIMTVAKDTIALAIAGNTNIILSQSGLNPRITYETRSNNIFKE